MSKRTRTASQDNPAPEVVLEEETDPPETRRTRSGRKIRTPASQLGCEVPLRTPSRRTRRSVLQEQPGEEDIKQEEGDIKPEEENIQPEGDDVKPQGDDVKPLEDDMKPEEGDNKPEEGDNKPVGEDIKPEGEVVESLMEEKHAETGSEEPQLASPAADPQPDVPVALETEKTEVNGGPVGVVSRPPHHETAPVSSETGPEKKKPRVAPGGTTSAPNPVIPLGKPKSGRVWKDRSKQRFSAMVRDKQLCSSWEKKMQAKREKELVKKYSQQLKDEKNKQKEDKRKRREENLKRREENERKAEIVQVIRNTTKIKRMKKKQLRKIEKRDTLALLQKSQKQNVKTKAQKNVGKDLT